MGTPRGYCSNPSIMGEETGTVELFINNGTGSGVFVRAEAAVFSDNIGLRLRAVELADFDGDGDLDMLAVGTNVNLRLTNADGVFTLVSNGFPAEAGTATSAAVADLDLDGSLDVVLGCETTVNNVYGSSVALSFVASTDFPPAPELKADARGIALGDVNV